VLQLRKIVNSLEKMYPIELQEKWDNCGFLIGRLDTEIEKILTTLDVTHEVIDKAIEEGVNLIISHHPIIFDGMKSIIDKTSHGDKVLRLIENRIAVISLHTNVDKHPLGLNDFLIKKLSGSKGKFLDVMHSSDVKLIIKNEQPVGELLILCEKLQHSSEIERYCSSENDIEMILRSKDLKKVINMIQCLKDEKFIIESFLIGHGRELGGLGNYFTLKESMTIREYAEFVKKALDISTLSIITKDMEKKIKRVAVISGGGGSLMKESYKKEIDLFITGDVNYHIAQDAKDYNLSVFDVGHYESEVIFCELLKLRLEEFFNGEIIEFGGTNPFIRM